MPTDDFWQIGLGHPPVGGGTAAQEPDDFWSTGLGLGAAAPPPAPSLLSRAGHAFETVTAPLGYMKRGVDALARAGARAQGLDVPDTATTGNMVRTGLGLDPSQGEFAQSTAGRVAGRALEFGTDVLTDPLTPILGGAGKLAGAGRAAETFVGPQSIEAAAQALQAIETGRKAATVGRAAAAAFTPGMVTGAVHEGMDALDTYRANGFTPEVAEKAFGAALGTGMAGLTASHAYHGTPPVAREPVKTFDTDTLLREMAAKNAPKPEPVPQAEPFPMDRMQPEPAAVPLTPEPAPFPEQASEPRPMLQPEAPPFPLDAERAAQGTPPAPPVPEPVPVPPQELAPVEPFRPAEEMIPADFVPPIEETPGPIDARAGERRQIQEDIGGSVADRRRAARREAIAEKAGVPADHPAVEMVMEAEKEARTDPLTGLNNKRGWTELRETVTPEDQVVSLDGKKFKAVNDTYGHDAGDAVLKSLGTMVREVFGEEAARSGGDEYNAILRGHTPEQADAAIARLQARAAETTVQYKHPKTGEVIDIPPLEVHIARGSNAEAADLAVNDVAAPSRKGGRGDVSPAGADPVGDPALAAAPGRPVEGLPPGPAELTPPQAAPPVETAPGPRFDRDAAIARLKSNGGKVNDLGSAAATGVSALRDAAIVGASYIEEYARVTRGKLPSFEQWARTVGDRLRALIPDIGKHIRRIYDEAVGLWQKTGVTFGSLENEPRGKVLGSLGGGLQDMLGGGEPKMPPPSPKVAEKFEAKPTPAPPAPPAAEARGPLPKEAPPAAPPPEAAEPAPAEPKPARPENFSIPEETTLEKLQRNVQDRFNRIAKVQGAIEKQGGKVTEHTDIAAATEAFGPKVAERIADVDRTHVENLTKTLAAEKLNLKDLDDYLYAKHALEANPILAEMDPQKRPALSGMDDATARQILDEGATTGKTERLAKAEQIIRQMEDERTRIIVESGLESQATVDAWKKKWGSNYVPFSSVDAEQISGAGRGFDIRGRETKQRFGREDRADSPTSFIVSQLHKTIVRAEKNLVGQRFAELVKENPDPKLWEMDKEHQRREVGPDGKVRMGADHHAYVDDFHYKVNGEERRITIADPLFKRALDGMNPQESNAIIQKIGQATRLYSGLVTKLNPEFVFTNAARDIQTAMGNLGVEHGAKAAKAAAKNVLPAVKAMWNVAKDPKAEGRMEQFAREYREDGGSIGFQNFRDVPALEKELQRKVKVNGPGALAAMQRSLMGIRDVVERANESVENGSRLAAYAALREAGISRQKAAQVSRNLTVNFTKRGEMGPTFNSLYAFFNANVQGGKRMVEVMGTKKGATLAAGIAALGASMDTYNRSVAGDSNNDGTNDYDDIPEYVKERNLVLVMGPGQKPLLFPMPYGFNVIHTAGRQASAAFAGAVTPIKAATSVAASAANAFNPLGGADAGLTQMLAPTVLDPFVQSEMNKDFTGKQIRPEPYPGSARKPDSETYFKNAPQLAKDIARVLNTATGGDKVTPGFIDVSPETLEHYWNFATGGLGRFGANVVNAGAALAEGEAPALKNIPVARRFVYEASPAAAGTKYRENVQELEDLDMRAKTYQRDKNRAGTASLSRAMLTAKRSVDQIDKQIAILRKREKATGKDQSEQIVLLQNRANKIVAAARRAPGGAA